MADIALTASLIRPLGGAVIRRGTAGGTLTPGQAVYLDGANGWKAADASAVATAKARGIVLSDGAGSVSFASGQTVDICVFGPVTGFAAMTPGAPVYLSETAGAVATAEPSTALSAAWVMGYAESAVTLFVNIDHAQVVAAIAALTDNSGGAANDTITAVTAAAAITDNSTGVDPANDTIAAITEAAAITDNSGGADPGDDIIAVVTQAANAGSADLAPTTAAIAQLAAKMNTNSLAIDSAADAIAQLAAKQNTTSTAVGSAMNNFADLAAKVNAILAALRDAGVIVN